MTCTVDAVQDEIKHVLALAKGEDGAEKRANAVKIMQRLVARMGFPCDDDGIVGPKTIAAVRAAAEAAPRHLADAYGIARRNYYYALADARPASRKYARRRDGGKGGWIVRAEAFMSPRFHLTDAEHRERTKAWP